MQLIQVVRGIHKHTRRVSRSTYSTPRAPPSGPRNNAPGATGAAFISARYVSVVVLSARLYLIRQKLGTALVSIRGGSGGRGGGLGGGADRAGNGDEVDEGPRQ